MRQCEDRVGFGLEDGNRERERERERERVMERIWISDERNS